MDWTWLLYPAGLLLLFGAGFCFNKLNPGGRAARTKDGTGTGGKTFNGLPRFSFPDTGTTPFRLSADDLQPTRNAVPQRSAPVPPVAEQPTPPHPQAAPVSQQQQQPANQWETIGNHGYAIPRPRNVRPEWNWFYNELCYWTPMQGRPLIVVGNMGSGKTALGNAILYERSKLGQFVIVDVAGNPEKWGGLKAWGAGDCWMEVQEITKTLEEEFSRRSKEFAKTGKQPPLLTVIFDEVPYVVMNLPHIGEFFRKLLVRGRELNMLIAMFAQYELVGALGLQNHGQVLKNCHQIRLGEVALDFVGRKAHKAVGDVSFAPGEAYPTLVEANGRLTKVSRAFVPEYEGVKLSDKNMWTPPAPDADVAVAEYEDVTPYDDVLVVPGSASSPIAIRTVPGVGGYPVPAFSSASSAPASNAEQPQTFGVAPAEPELRNVPELSKVERFFIVEQLQNGMSANAIADELGGRRQTRLAQIKIVRAELDAAN